MGWILGERKENRQTQLSESTLVGLSRLFNRQIQTLADGAPQLVTAAVETQDPLDQPCGEMLGLTLTPACVHQVLLLRAVSGIATHPDLMTGHTRRITECETRDQSCDTSQSYQFIKLARCPPDPRWL